MVPVYFIYLLILRHHYLFYRCLIKKTYQLARGFFFNWMLGQINAKENTLLNNGHQVIISILKVMFPHSWQAASKHSAARGIRAIVSKRKGRGAHRKWLQPHGGKSEASPASPAASTQYREKQGKCQVSRAFRERLRPEYKESQEKQSERPTCGEKKVV